MTRAFQFKPAAVANGASAFLLTDHGRPFASSGSLDNRVRKWVIQAGLFETVTDEKGYQNKEATRSQHGIRKARAEEIAEQGGSVYEVMAYLSHNDPKTAAIYTKRVDRSKLAKQAADRLDANQIPQVVPRPEKRRTTSAVNARQKRFCEVSGSP